MKFGIDRLLEEPQLRKPLAGRRVALLAHPASVTRNLVHSLDALAALRSILAKATRSVPPAGMAWSALIVRFWITGDTWPA